MTTYPQDDRSADELREELAELAEEIHKLQFQNLELRKKQQELSMVVSHSKCLPWHAIVEEQDGKLWWTIHVFSDDHEDFVTTDELRGPTWAHAWHYDRHPEDVPRIDRTAAQAIRAGKDSYSHEFRCIGPDNNLYWLDEYVAIKKMGPKEWQLFGVCTDITARRQWEEELHYIVTDARCILWHSIVYEYMGTMTWNVRIPNEESVQDFLPIEVKEGQTWAEAWYEHVPAEDRGKMDEVSHDALCKGKDGYEHEFRCLAADGKLHWLSEIVRIEQMKPNVWNLVGVCTDVTERKEAEKEVRQLRELLPICAACKKIRDDGGYWNQLETYLHDRSIAEFSHGICPDCARKLYPDYFDQLDNEA